MKELFKVIAEVHPLLPGWCSTEKAITMASLVLAYRPEVTVEIGVFGGASFIPMALAHKAIGHGVAIGIDPWDTKIAVKEQTTILDREWWADTDMNVIHGDFMNRLALLRLESVTRIQRQTSNQAHPPHAVGLLHVDGSHSATALSDIIRYAPKVVSGGFVVTDDSEWKGGGVAMGEQRLIQIGFKRLYALGTGAVFQRISTGNEKD